jgi:hypothetical protein
MKLAGLDELRGILIRVVKSGEMLGATERGAQIILMYIEHRGDRATTQIAAFHGASSNPANLSVPLSILIPSFPLLSHLCYSFKINKIHILHYPLTLMGNVKPQGRESWGHPATPAALACCTCV